MVTSTTQSRLLVAVSVAQLATGVAGLVVALRRRHPYDVFLTHGRTDTIARDTILRGTALSAPVSNLLAQAALTAVMARRPGRGAARALGGLGALHVAGYLGERLVRRRLRRSGWDALESPLVVAGIGLAGAMAVLGARRNGRGRSIREGALYGGLPYLAIGQGPPLVVFVGLTAEHANTTGLARQFELQTLKPMARHFTVYAVNRKPGLPPGSTIRDLAGDYAEAIARDFPGPVAVWGISTGGSIAQQFAIDHPQLVRRLVLAATACRLSPYGRQVQRRLAELISSQRPDDPSDMLVTVAAEDSFDASWQLHRITAPTLLVAGARDRFYSPELFQETAERIPGARLRLYPGKGHAGVMTHGPAIREIVAFLRADKQAQNSGLRPEWSGIDLRKRCSYCGYLPFS
jgi:pimeloyl-ACP methyl ester carboxylesterase